jgi:hypothetical protein
MDSYRVLVDVQNAATLDDVNRGIQQKKSFMIYYSPQCVWCQRLKPELVKVDKELRKYDLKGQIVSVPPSFIPKIKGHNTISGFPSLILLDVGGEKKAEYNNDRTSEQLLSFLEHHGLIQKKRKKRKTRRKKKRTRRSTKRH